MRVVLCAIAKNENKYINDWAHYYFNLGFDHIYLYDNNFSKEPYVGNCFDDDIKNKITVFNVQNICGQDIQVNSYNNFYRNYKNTFDWCLFCDIDEFLDGITDIHSFFETNSSKFKDVYQIRVKWRLFGDDDLLERDETIPVYKFFKKIIKDHPGYSDQGKMFLKGNLNPEDITILIHSAVAKNNKNLPSCLPSGKPCPSCLIYKKSLTLISNYQEEVVYLNHYRTKTLKEFLNQKFGRTDCDRWSFQTIDISYFFEINKNTPEKQEYIKKWLQKKIEERRK